MKLNINLKLIAKKGRRVPNRFSFNLYSIGFIDDLEALSDKLKMRRKPPV